MASGLVHFDADKKIALLACIGGAVGTAITNNTDFVLGAILGSTFGILLTNDIDQPGGTYNEYLVELGIKKLLRSLKFSAKTARRLGRLAKKLFMALTAFYAMPIKHRSIFSHLPPLSTITKLAYVYTVYWVTCRIIGTEAITDWTLLLNLAFFIMFGVYMLHDTVHLILDGGMLLSPFSEGKTARSNHFFLFGTFFYERMRIYTANKDEKLRKK